MAITREEIKALLNCMEFYPLNGTEEVWEKKYTKHNDYRILVDFDKELINYQTDDVENCLIVSNKTTSNFSCSENFVVLECVNRLLEKGYHPNSIELEHSWPSGRGTSGRLDILIKRGKDVYLMIECKTYGTEFDNEKNNMLSLKKVGSEEQPKGQLFSYFIQEKTTEYLCLYTSKFNGTQIQYKNVIIPVEGQWKNLSNQKEVFDHWNKTFKYNGIFEDGINPFNIECKSLIRRDLQKITHEDSSRIFNQFLEILRHNAVSDKPNAFNKILNLFICKIIDEDRHEDEELKFQWKDDSTFISLQSDLEDLYKQGMDKFLDIEVTDYSDNDIDEKLALMDSNTKIVVKKMFQELRLQKNQEFAFKEVYNQESFNDNAKVVKEIVRLLQPYQFRYGHKQQFLGNFFELLLNTSIKQESGQFFTPLPVAKFMISSLPIREKIDEKIKANKKEILPTMIDYACGAGHFLTEYMDIVQGIINNYDTKELKKSLSNVINKWKQTECENELQGEFEWAKDYVYGVEKDYRLVKTTKISTFLNGDGDANVIHADGLDKFTSSKYKGILASKTNHNYNFDFIIANPPYSVASFKQTLPCDNDDFELYELLTDNSSEIECLFVERSIQLLKENGIAAIILPSSILSNSSQITERTREMILKKFYIRAIAKMGQNTFMATGTNTVIMFLEKRPETEVTIVEQLLNDFFSNFKDFTCLGVSNLIQKYVQECLGGVLLEDYIQLLQGIYTDQIQKTDYYKEVMDKFINCSQYKSLIKKRAFKSLSEDEQNQELTKLFKKFIMEIEKKKIQFYILTHNNQTLIIESGDKKEEKNFLGYEFSNRRGHEGIHYHLDQNKNIDSALYDDVNLYENKKKVNYYVNQTFKNKYPSIPDELKDNLRYIKSSELLTFDYYTFTTAINLNKKKKNEYGCESIELRECVNIKIGGTPSRRNSSYFKGNSPWVSIAEMNGQTITTTKEMITKEAIKNSNVKLIKKGTTLLSFKLSIGKVAIAGVDLYTNEAIAALEIKDEYKDRITNEFLFCLFKSKAIDIEGDTKAFGISLNSKTLGNVIIPLPSIEKQEEFINQYLKIDNSIKEKEDSVDSLQDSIDNYIESIKDRGYKSEFLSKVAYFRRGPFGGSLKKEIFVTSGYKVYEQQHAIKNDFSIGNYYITEEKYNEMKALELKPNDIIMSCSGTIGKFAIVPKTAEKGIINQALLRFRCYDDVLPVYLKLALENITHEFETKSHGLGLKNVASVDTLKMLKIVVPPIPEQQKIINEVSEIEDKIRIIKDEIEVLKESQYTLSKKFVSN